ncbi:thiamine biosynthesis protein [Mucilaginibacter sp. PAMC 26640]|nr:thiamine biosynthesis protein [Mucilaginibacter sp. PAMC 26640]
MQTELLRYSCQVNLPGFGEAAQQRMQMARVLIIGAGGLGCPAAQYLVSSGVGTVGIADFDIVSESNLHRQILYSPDDIGKSKALTACKRLSEQNPAVTLIPITSKITSDNIIQVFDFYDIIIDGTDNFDTRYLINDAAVLTGKPVVYGAIYQYEGQVAVWNLINQDGSRSPNYRDLYPEVDATQVPNCSVGGVIPTLAGIIGCMQANEVIKYITQTGDLLSGKVLLFDARSMQSRVIKIGTVTKTNIVALTQTNPVATITAQELYQLQEAGRVQLVDVRTYQERDLDDIGGDHVPLDELEENVSQLDPEKTTVFYCATGKRSGEAVKLIRKLRPELKVFSLENGMDPI